jgi:hypothetical protein
VVDTHVFCRRHAGTVSALPGDAGAGALLPALDNRAPSLVSWVAREIDADVRQLLLRLPRVDEGAQVLAEPLYLISVGPEHRRAWERCWRVVTTGGTAVRVALAVEEDMDSEVVVRVGGNIAGRYVPPWIAERLSGQLRPSELDGERRVQFNQRLVSVISLGIRRHLEVLGLAGDSDTEA